jgi:hypothetical protein
MNSGRDMGWPYWSVDLPGLDEKEANDLLALAEQAGIGSGGSTVNPGLFLTVHLDADTVKSLARVLNDACTGKMVDAEAAEEVSGLSEILQEWIDSAK